MDELTAFMCADGNFKPREKFKPRPREPTKLVLSLSWALEAARRSAPARALRARGRLSHATPGAVRPAP